MNESAVSWRCRIGTVACCRPASNQLLGAVPKVIVFDRTEQLRQVVHGASPDLQERLEAAVTQAIR